MQEQNSVKHYWRLKMRTLTCDMPNCSNTIDVANNYSTPKGWTHITITGAVGKIGSAYPQNQSIRKDICDECTLKVFDFSEDPPKSLQDQFHDAAMDYLDGLAIDAIEAAAENR